MDWKGCEHSDYLNRSSLYSILASPMLAMPLRQWLSSVCVPTLLQPCWVVGFVQIRTFFGRGRVGKMEDGLGNEPE